MKTISHLMSCIALIIFALTGCDKNENIDQAKETASSETEDLTNVDSVTTTKTPLSTIRFDNPEDGYFQAYLFIQKSEKIADKQESSRILKEALGHFKAVKSQFPDWKTSMVDARIQDTQQKLESLSMGTR